MFAGVPCYNLKSLHAATVDDMLALRTLFGAWKEMRETWTRQKTDPDYAYDTPVPTEGLPRRDRDQMAASIGELGPKEQLLQINRQRIRR